VASFRLVKFQIKFQNRNLKEGRVASFYIITYTSFGATENASVNKSTTNPFVEKQ
jgi:hypothetical protein